MEEDQDEVLSMDLIAVSNLLDQQLATSSAQHRAAACSKLMTVRLDSLHLCSLSASVLQQLSACRSLHLQDNCLTSCSALTALRRLTFLAMAHNQLQQVEGLQELTGLLFLDISHNMVQQLDARHLPGSIKYLKVAGNPCSCQLGLVQQLLQSLPRLKELDSQDVSNKTAASAVAPAVAPAAGTDCLTDAEQDAGSAGGTSDAEDTEEDCYISRQLAGLQHIEQGCRSRQLASARPNHSSCSTNRRSGHVAADCGASGHNKPGLQCESSCSWVADVRCSQQLASRIIKSGSSSNGASDMQQASPTDGIRLSHGSQPGFSPPPAEMLRKSISLPGCSHSSTSTSSNNSSSIAGTSCSRAAIGQLIARPLPIGSSGGSSTCATRRCSAAGSSSAGNAACAGGCSSNLLLSSSSRSSSSSSSRFVSSQRVRAPRLLSRPKSAGGYLPAQPRLCPAASLVHTTAAASRACDHVDASVAMPCSKAGTAAAAAAPAAVKQASGSKGPAQLAQRPQQGRVLLNCQARPGPQIASSASNKRSTNISQAGRQVASAGCDDSRETGSNTTTQGNTSSMLRSRTKSKVSNDCKGQPDGSSNSSCSSSQAGKDHFRTAEMTGSTTGARKTSSNAAGSSKAMAKPAAAAAAAKVPPGQQRSSAAPRRLPSLPRAVGTVAATIASSGMHGTTSKQQQQQLSQQQVVTGETGSCCSARPASAGVRLAPVQHTALSAVYEHCSSSSSSSSSRPSTSTSSGSADTRYASRAASSSGSKRSIAAQELCTLSESAQYVGSDVVLAADSVAAHHAAAEDRGRLLQGCVAASATAATTAALDAARLNAVAANACLAISSTAAAMQQRSKQRTADARQQQVQEQLEQRQQLEQGIKQLRERGLQLLRAGLPVSAGSSTGHPDTVGLQTPCFLQGLSADSVAAEIASRAERLRARLTAASLQVQEAAAAPIAAGPEVPAVIGFKQQQGSAGGSAALSNSGTPSSCSNGDEAAFVQGQVMFSLAGVLLERQTENTVAADVETASAGSDISMDSDLESLVAGVFKPTPLPDWTSVCHSAHVRSSGSCSNSSTDLTDRECVVEDFGSMFKVSLPPGLQPDD